jgi:hypothetical protein
MNNFIVGVSGSLKEIYKNDNFHKHEPKSLFAEI